MIVPCLTSVFHSLSLRQPLRENNTQIEGLASAVTTNILKKVLTEEGEDKKD